MRDRTNLTGRPAAFSASNWEPSAAPISLLIRQRLTSMRVKTHCQKAIRHKSEPPTILILLLSPDASKDGAS